MSQKELVTALFLQALMYYYQGDDAWAEDTLFTALSVAYTGFPFPTHIAAGIQ